MPVVGVSPVDGAVDEVDAGLVAAAGEGDVALLEAGLVAGVVERAVEGGALDAVGGAGVAVVEVAGLEVACGDVTVPSRSKATVSAPLVVVDAR